MKAEAFMPSRPCSLKVGTSGSRPITAAQHIGQLPAIKQELDFVLHVGGVALQVFHAAIVKPSMFRLGTSPQCCFGSGGYVQLFGLDILRGSPEIKR